MKLSDPIKLPEANVRTLLGVVAAALGVVDIVLLVKLALAVFAAHRGFEHRVAGAAQGGINGKNAHAQEAKVEGGRQK